MKNPEAAAFVITLVLITGCAEQKTPERGSPPTSVPESHSFLMGMTPWPYDFTEEAVHDIFSTTHPRLHPP